MRQALVRGRLLALRPCDGARAASQASSKHTGAHDMNATHRRVGLLLLASGLAACSSTGPSAGGGSTVSFNTATRAGTPPSASKASFSTTPTPLSITLGANTLDLTDVQLVARHIELQREGKDVTCENDVNHQQDCE